MESTFVSNVEIDALPHYMQPASLQGFEYSFTSLGKRKIHILHEIKVLPDNSPAVGCAPAVLLLRPALVGLYCSLGSPRGSQTNCSVSYCQIHPPPFKHPPTGKSYGDLEVKDEHRSRCGSLEKNAAKGPSSQTLLVNATSVHEKSSEKSRCSRLAQLGSKQRGVEAVGTGSRVIPESIRTAKPFSCNPETENCSKSHLPLPPSPAKHSFS